MTPITSYRSTLPRIDLTSQKHNQENNEDQKEILVRSVYPTPKRYKTKKGQVCFYDLTQSSQIVDDREENLVGSEQEQDFSLIDLKPLGLKYFQNLEAYPYDSKTDYDFLRWLCAMMMESPLAYSLLKEFEANGWYLCITNLENGGYSIDYMEKTLEIDNFGLDASSLGRSSVFRNMIMMNFAKALRDIWHEEQGYNFITTYKPATVLLLERVRAADCDAVAMMIAWELRSAGYKELWRYALSNDDSDMAQVLINITEAHPKSIFNGIAIAHVFRQWYTSTERLDASDHATLEALDAALLDKAQHAIGMATPMPDVIGQLSLLPDGKRYLENVTETVLRDPFFCKFDNPINEAHLFQITYEMKVTICEGVAFRDAALARKIFPQTK